ncbi:MULTISPECIES: arginine repressor [Clostridia]|uniref:arginine repressor n=1 Tax=Clostridia TaxID=186801 RepID=UPI000EA00D6D|nr:MULTISPECIES: arginine repressor [Clostridia]NBJ71047.1 arginine repressor [Roseburia sp. 1XD42-34]RKI75329.1 arginine repressor [Clostridium sp. 1xD42-85]
MSKQDRQEKIRELLRINEVRTQKDLWKLLKDCGYNVTPTTISRDIQEMQIRKEYSPDGVERYSLSNHVKVENPDLPIKQLQQFYSEAIQSIEVTGVFVIIKTEPGNAKPIGYLMESLNWKSVVGVISGDDNCLLLCRTKSEADEVKKKCMTIWNKNTT